MTEKVTSKLTCDGKGKISEEVPISFVIFYAFQVQFTCGCYWLYLLWSLIIEDLLYLVTMLIIAKSLSDQETLKKKNDM